MHLGEMSPGSPANVSHVYSELVNLELLCVVLCGLGWGRVRSKRRNYDEAGPYNRCCTAPIWSTRGMVMTMHCGRQSLSFHHFFVFLLRVSIADLLLPHCTILMTTAKGVGTKIRSHEIYFCIRRTHERATYPHFKRIILFYKLTLRVPRS